MPPEKSFFEKVLGKYVALGNQYFNVVVKLFPATWAMVTGAGLVAGGLVLILLFPCPDFELVRAVRLMLSVGLSLLIAGLLGKGENDPQQIERFRLALKGAVAATIFTVTYLITPPAIRASSSCNDQLLIEGQLLLANKPLAGVPIRIDHLQVEDITNSQGYFQFKLSSTESTPDSIVLGILFHSIDTLLHIDPLVSTGTVTINLPDTLQQLTSDGIRTAIWQHLNAFEQWIDSEHQKHFKTGGSVCSLPEIIREYRNFELGPVRKDNFTYYNRQFELLDTQGDLKRAGIPIKPFSPHKAHYLNRYEGFCWYPLIANPHSYHFEYALRNKDKLAFTIDRIETVSKSRKLITVTYSNPVRYILAEVSYGPETQGQRKLIHNYYGVFPREQHTLQFQNGRWLWTGAKRIDKPL